MKSYYFVIPKRVFTEEQLLQFREMMKAQLQEKYDDRSDKLKYNRYKEYKQTRNILISGLNERIKVK